MLLSPSWGYLGAGEESVCDARAWTWSPCAEQVCVLSFPWGLWGEVRKGRTEGPHPHPPKLTPCLLSHSWAFGSNSLPIAGSVGMGVARRTQRQFPMPPRALPPGRMGLLSPSGIGGISPRHALTSPSLGGQGRQVSRLEAEDVALLGLGWWCLGCVCPYLCIWARRGRERLLCQLHGAWAWDSSLSAHHFLFSRAPCRTCGLPTPEAATACPARAAALCSAPTPSRSIRRPRPFSCSLQVNCPYPWGSASATP